MKRVKKEWAEIRKGWRILWSKEFREGFRHYWSNKEIARRLDDYAARIRGHR